MSLITNLAAYYKFDENSGNSVGDSIGVNTGTWGGTLGSQWTPGKINSGGNFNGSDNNVKSNLWSNAISNISMGGWFKSSDYTKSRQCIISNGNGAGGGGGYAIILSGNGTTDGSLYILNHGIAWDFGSHKVQDNNWHHVMMTYDGTTILLYLDNSQIYSGGNPSFGTPVTNSYIGDDNSGSGFFKGVLDEMGFWTRALSSSEVSQLYNSGAGLQYPFSTRSNQSFLLMGVGS